MRDAMGFTFRLMTTLALLLVAMPATAQDARIDALYQAKVIVTGQREASRPAAFREALGLALVKLTGDPAVIDDRRFDKLQVNAAALVADFRYRDLLAHKPLADEQGTYDRPYELTVTFDHARLDAAARTLGRKPWLTPRPRVAVVLGIENFGKRYVLSADGAFDRSVDLREALTAAAERVGLMVALPAQADITARGLDAARIADKVEAAALTPRGDVALAGHMRFSEQALSWIEHWRLDLRGRPVAWRARDVTFDEALRRAMRGAVKEMRRARSSKP